VAWEPTQQEIEEKLISLAYLWGDIEESTEDIPFTPERGIRLHRFTGSQVHADASGCVTELTNLLRGAASRP